MQIAMFMEQKDVGYWGNHPLWGFIFLLCLDKIDTNGDEITQDKFRRWTKLVFVCHRSAKQNRWRQ